MTSIGGICPFFHFGTPPQVTALASRHLQALRQGTAEPCEHLTELPDEVAYIDANTGRVSCEPCFRTSVVDGALSDPIGGRKCSTCDEPAVVACTYGVPNPEIVLIVTVNACLTCTSHAPTFNLAKGE